MTAVRRIVCVAATLAALAAAAGSSPPGPEVVDQVGVAHLDTRPGWRTVDTGTDGLLKAAGLVRADRAAAAGDAAPVTSGAGTVAWLSSHVGHACTGDGTTGNRVQALYVREASRPSRFAAIEPVLRRELAVIDDVLAASAAQTGGGLAVRWVHDADCRPILTEVQVPDGTFTGQSGIRVTPLRAAGLTSSSRKYLMFADPVTPTLCGVGNVADDARPTGNLNDGARPMYARIDPGCWVSGETSSVAAHELVHTLGAVVDAAPHATGSFHCRDNADLMCYTDSSGAEMDQVCAPAHEPLLDCGGDDYLHMDPPAGTWLASHWNVASSSFLARVPALPAGPAVRLAVTELPGQRLVVDADPADRVRSLRGFTPHGCVEEPAAHAAQLRYACRVPAGQAVRVDALVFGTSSPLAALATVTAPVAAHPLQVKAPARLMAGGRARLSASLAGSDDRASYTWTVDERCTLWHVAARGARARLDCGRVTAGDTVEVSVAAKASGPHPTWTVSRTLPVVARPDVRIVGPRRVASGRWADLSTRTVGLTGPVSYSWTVPDGCRVRYRDPSGSPVQVSCRRSRAGQQVRVRVVASAGNTRVRDTHWVRVVRRR